MPKLHMTVSVRLSKKNAEIAKGAIGKIIDEDNWLNDVVDTYFQDIADRGRHFIYEKEKERVIGLEEFKNKYISIVFSMPKELTWTTEGENISVNLGSEVALNAKARQFWYRHVGGWLTFNISFEIDYDNKLLHYYALSAIQKALFPTEDSESIQSNIKLKVDPKKNQGQTLLEFIKERINQVNGKDKKAIQIDLGDKELIKATYLFDDEFFYQMLNQCSCNRDPGVIFTDQDTRTSYDQGLLQKVDLYARQKGALYFISGFTRNVIDFFRQDGAEVTDGTDFHYPTLPTDNTEEAKAQLESNSYVLYVNDHSIYEFVPSLRSLDSANDYIGTCPYLFFVHMMALHNEALLKDFESRMEELLEMVECKNIEDDNDNKTMVRSFDLARHNILRNIEKYKHMNMLRYDTEQEFYQAISHVRGLQERQDYWEKLLNKIETKVSDVRERLRQDSEDRLNKLVLAIGFLSLFQVLFQATEAARKLSPRKEEGDETGWALLNDLPTAIDMPLMVLALVISAVAIISVIIILIKKEDKKENNRIKTFADFFGWSELDITKAFKKATVILLALFLLSSLLFYFF